MKLMGYSFDQSENPLQKILDPMGIGKAIMEAQMAWLNKPQESAAKYQAWLTGLSELQLHFLRRSFGMDTETSECKDPRFKDKSWSANLYFDVIKESFLYSSHFIEEMFDETPDLDKHTKRKASFWINQFFNAISPSNNFWTNPEAINRCVETNGMSVIEGLKLFSEDMKGNDISMVDKSAFEVGRNLATTPGKVIYRCDLFELIQYEPTTKDVSKTPILIVPPWINKFYVMDLNEKKSMMRYLVSQGFSVFLISWRNVPKELGDTKFEDYLTKGIDVAANVVTELAGVDQVHAVGYCIGGTALSSYMAWMNANPDKNAVKKVAHWTLFASLTDFSNPGEIENFLDEDSLDMLAGEMEKDGYLDGSKMNAAFRTLRSNSLVWNYFVNSYLKGQKPDAFDLLYWNSDPTRLPKEMHKFYLREFYINNALVKKDQLVLAGRKMDLGKITQPLYDVAAEQDHITPWRECFKTSSDVGAPVRQVLGSSGHILGIISPPVKPPKRKYWAGDMDRKKFKNADEWLAAQKEQAGSWWDDWTKWLNEKCGDKVPALKVGSRKYKAICEAPGEYVVEP
ncbi:MAG: class I poly(R)-hydroxyalkanoic acid synthase [Gammaproteobacteria bacterium]|nr:MAG: class I poly(R)-hydroxyalkanoic acid synthase [Gammaproteobacteria bacterium]